MPPEHKRPRPIWLTAGVAGVSAFVATGVWLWSREASPALPAVERPVGAVHAGVEVGPPSGPPGQLGEALETPAASRTQAPAPLDAHRADSPVVRRLPAAEPAVGLPSAAPAADVRLAPLPIGPLTSIAVPSKTASPAAAAEVVTLALPVVSASSVDRTRVYSGADSDVTPPSMIDASLPPPLLSDGREVNTMELVISERGHVERVRLISKPRRMADMMLLSGAKNWKFEPASKDGFSVKYRLLLSWAATP